MKKKEIKTGVKKPIFKKWWFWVVIILLLIGIIGNMGGKKNTESGEKGTADSSSSVSQTDEKQTEEKQTEESQSEESQDEESEEESAEIAGISFRVSDVRNDVTGNWRIAKIAENIDMKDYALEYYKKYFKSDDEIHAIVNFNNRTTTQISVMSNLLDVSVYEYVDKEEHDAKLLFSGMLLKEYHINMDTGEIEEVQ